MKIIKLNDLYFPQGNEKGDYFEPYYQAINDDGKKGYGPTPETAINSIGALQNDRN